MRGITSTIGIEPLRHHLTLNGKDDGVDAHLCLHGLIERVCDRSFSYDKTDAEQ